MSRDARSRALVEILRRRRPDVEATFRRYDLSATEALTVLDDSILEVQLRCQRIEHMEARLLRAIARGCTAVIDERRESARPVDAD